MLETAETSQLTKSDLTEPPIKTGSATADSTEFGKLFSQFKKTVISSKTIQLMKDRSSHKTKGEKKRHKLRSKHRLNQQPSYDPLCEDILFLLKKRKKTGKPNTETQRFKKAQQVKKMIYAAKQARKRYSYSAKPSFGVLTIVRFFRETDGYTEILVQQDIQDDGKPKGKPGFVFGGSDSPKELPEVTSRRETEEEAGIPTGIGQTDPIDTMTLKGNYSVHGYVRTVPFDTPNNPGTEIFRDEKTGFVKQIRFSKAEVDTLVEENVLLIKHCIMYRIAKEKGLL